MYSKACFLARTISSLYVLAAVSQFWGYKGKVGSRFLPKRKHQCSARKKCIFRKDFKSLLQAQAKSSGEQSLLKVSSDKMIY